MNGPENSIDFCHGYTYSGHPLAMAAGMATLDVYKEEGIFEHAKEMSKYFEEAIHSLKGLPYVVDIRNIGLMGGIELTPIPGDPTKRAYDVFMQTYENNVMVRVAGDGIVLSPPLIIEREHIDRIIDTLRKVIRNLT
jgi:beta-alanine--pyruvate transaminase